jgi:hypothetical protein
MDILCRNCGEPWDMDSLHEEIDARWPDKPWIVNGVHDQAVYERDHYAVVSRDFRRNGCKAMWAMSGNPKGHVPSWCHKTEASSDTVGAIYDLLGGDMDGAASMLDDAEALGLL